MRIRQFSISCFHASGHKLEVNILVQLLWLKSKGGRIFGGGRILRNYGNSFCTYLCVFRMYMSVCVCGRGWGVEGVILGHLETQRLPLLSGFSS